MSAFTIKKEIVGQITKYREECDVLAKQYDGVYDSLIAKVLKSPEDKRTDCDNRVTAIAKQFSNAVRECKAENKDRFPSEFVTGTLLLLFDHVHEVEDAELTTLDLMKISKQPGVLTMTDPASQRGDESRKQHKPKLPQKLLRHIHPTKDTPSTDDDNN